MRDGKLNYLIQMGLRKNPEIAAPLAHDLLTKQEDKQLLELLMAGTGIGRNFAAAPGTPRERIEILRKAFDATMKDPAFIAEGAQMQAEVEPTNGEETQRILANVYATPKPIVERAKKLIAPASN